MEYSMNNMNVMEVKGPSLEPGKKSTEFIGKVVIQILVILNAILHVLNKPSLAISPEVSVAIAGGIEAIWIVFRQWNKRLELTAQSAIMHAHKAIEMEATKSAARLRENQAMHQLNLEKLKFENHLKKEEQPNEKK
jgi:hypothetical protein